MTLGDRESALSSKETVLGDERLRDEKEVCQDGALNIGF